MRYHDIKSLVLSFWNYLFSKHLKNFNIRTHNDFLPLFVSFFCESDVCLYDSVCMFLWMHVDTAHLNFWNALSPWPCINPWEIQWFFCLQCSDFRYMPLHLTFSMGSWPSIPGPYACWPSYLPCISQSLLTCNC